MRLGIIGIWIIVFVIGNVHAQVAPGNWRTFASHKQVNLVVEANQKMYFITTGGMFSYDREDHSLTEYNKSNGLASNQIVAAEWSESKQALVIAYQNSDIDLLFENDLVNLSDLKRKNITGDKSINNIHVKGNDAYLACSFGIVVVNLEKEEIKDTYIIGSEGSYLKVNDITHTQDKLYAATNNGIYFIELNDPNPLDYSHWQKEMSIANPNGKYLQINFSEDHQLLLVSYKDDSSNDVLVYYKQGENAWQKGFNSVYHAFDIDVDDDLITISGWYDVQQFNYSLQRVERINTYPGDCVPMVDGKPIFINGAKYNEGGLWIADKNYGAIHLKDNQCECVQIESPENNDVYGITINGPDVYVARGGRSQIWVNAYNPFQIKKYDGLEWSTFDSNQFPDLDGRLDVLDVAFDPTNQNRFFAGCWYGGVAEFYDGELIEVYDATNSSLESTFDGQNFVRIGGIEFDKDGNLWVANSEVTNQLSVLRSNGEWESFNLPEIANTKRVGDIVTTKSNNVWVIVTGANGIYVMSGDGSEKKHLNVTSYFTNGSDVLFTPMNDVLSIAEDLDGAIWVGTTLGVTYYNNPERVFSEENFYAYQPGLDIGDNIYHPLLEDEVVTAIAIDGANRKWFGTRYSGVYLISEDGEKEILHFDTDNSPLFSNNITDIEIEQESGTVYIGTNEGLLSYRSDAVRSKNAFDDLYVYPNPVRETYHGNVYINGLQFESNVKITTVSGRLVYETTSLGGQAVWDGKDLDGKRVHTGVYLVFCATRDGSESAMTKLLFIR